MSILKHRSPLLTARRALGALVALVGATVWTHTLAGPLRVAAGLSAEELAPAALGLTLAAILAGLAGSSAAGTLRGALSRSGVAAFLGWAALSILAPSAALPALALLPAAVGASALGSWLARRLPAAIDELPRRFPKLSWAWAAVALLAVVQVGRLSTYMTDAESDWFLTTRHPFYAKHECANAYVYGAELDRRGEENVYDPCHYPGLNPEAEPTTEIAGLSPEDPFQYPPPFLLLPRLAIELTADHGAIRMAWFGLNVTLCLAAMIALSTWVGGRTGMLAGILTPAVLASFPVLHDFQYGQVHFAAVALAVLGSVAFQTGRRPLGGFLLAGAILAKMFPAILLVPLAVQRRWRELGWTAAAGAGISLLALWVLGPAPFTAFADFHLPRLLDGSAFAFDEAWPEVAMLVQAGNQGIHGIVGKLAAMGVPGAGDAMASFAGRAFFVVLVALGALVGLRGAGAPRSAQAVAWLGLLGLGSLSSTGAWADYVPLTGVWLLAFLFPMAHGYRLAQFALGLCALMQVTLLGTMPLGEWADASWMMPLSLLGALLLLGTFSAATLVARPSAEAVSARLVVAEEGR